METTPKKKTTRKKTSNVEFGPKGFKAKNASIGTLVLLVIGIILIVFIINYSTTTNTKTTNPDGSVTETITNTTLRQKH